MESIHSEIKIFIISTIISITIMLSFRSVSDYDMDGQAPFWSAYFITLGGASHELGHTFDLGHSSAEFGLMGMGFYSFHRLFMPVNGDLTVFPEDQLPYFTEYDENGANHIGKILQSPWFN